MQPDIHDVTDRLDGPWVRRVRRAAVEVPFGDATGVTLFCGVLAVYVLTWRVGMFITDIGLYSMELNRVAAGHLSVGRIGRMDVIYPGMVYDGPLVYGRNYGQVVASLPAYWLIDAIGPGRFRWVVVVGWSGLVGGVVARVARPRGRRVALLAGSAVAVAAFVVNAGTLKPFTEGTDTIALQATAMVVATMSAVLLYRLVARQSGPKLGLLAGGAVALATPVGFWATVPKRHAFTATLVLVALYALARSREDATGARLGQAGFRAVAYASAGLLAWIHAPLGFTLFLALAVVDLPTAPANDARTLAMVGGAFLVSLGPFFLTNYAISGNPVYPPRFLPAYVGPEYVPKELLPSGPEATATNASGGSAVGNATADAGGDAGTSTTTDSPPTATPVAGPLEGLDLAVLLPTALVVLLRRGLFQYLDGMVVAVTNPGRLVTVFLRWGRHGYDPVGIFFGNGTNVSVLESAPIAAAVAVAPIRYGIDRVRIRDEPLALPVTTVDAFAIVFSLLLVALYMNQMPKHLLITVRYLHPLYPLLVYALFRQRWLVEALEDHADVALWSYEATVLFGTPLVVGVMIFGALPTKGEFFQTFGLVALAAAALLAACGLGSLSERLDPRASAVSAGVAAGVGTAFLLLTALVVMHYGMSALPVVDTVSGEVRFAILRGG